MLGSQGPSTGLVQDQLLTVLSTVCLGPRKNRTPRQDKHPRDAKVPTLNVDKNLKGLQVLLPELLGLPSCVLLLMPATTSVE